MELRLAEMSGSAGPILNLLGEKVALGPVQREQMPLYLRWLNDFDVLRTSSQVRPTTAEVLAWSFDEAAQARDEVHFTIYERSSLRPIGGTNLYEIRGRTAMFAISIGQKECWGKGYGAEATRLVLDYGFSALGLYNVMLTVYSHNERA